MILVEKYGEQTWILQCMTAIQEAVQNSVQMLSGAAPVQNAQALRLGGQYSHPARTAQELQASQSEAAINGTVSAANARQQAMASQAEASLAAGNVDMFEKLQRAAGMQDPATGQVAPQQQEAPSEPRSNEWIL